MKLQSRGNGEQVLVLERLRIPAQRTGESSEEPEILDGLQYTMQKVSDSRMSKQISITVLYCFFQEQLVAYSQALKMPEPKSFPPLRMAVMQSLWQTSFVGK